MAKKAIIYARVSTVKQADEGLPIDGQIEQAQAKAAQLGATVARVFRDDGISGRTAKRPAFQEALAYCAAFDVDYFITWSSSRFARNKVDAGTFKKDLQRYGTRLVYVSGDIDPESDEGWITDSLFEIMDEHYSRTIAKDTRRSMIKNARDGHYNGGRVPFGFVTVADGKRKRLAVNPVEAQTVRDVFVAYLQGAGTKSIAMALNAAGRARRGRRWSKNVVTALLKNWACCGYVTFNRVDASGALRPECDWIRTRSHAAIIDEEDFMRVQRQFTERAPVEAGGAPRSNFLFTGLLRCGRCNRAMQTEGANGHGGRYHYYNCSSAQKGLGCAHRRLPAADLDAWLTGVILDRIVTVDRIREIAREVHELKGSWVKERERRRDALVAELRAAEGRRSKIFEVLELHGKSAPNLGDLTVRLRALNEQIKSIEVALTTLEEQPAPEMVLDEAELHELGDFLRQTIEECANPKKVRAFFASFIETVVVNGPDVVINYRPDRLIDKRRFDVVHSGARWLPDQGSNLGPAD